MGDSEQVGAIAAVKGKDAVVSDMGWIWRDQHERDVGIDAIIETKDEGKATGRMIGVQVKGGESHSDGKYIKIKKRHWVYWKNCTLPMIFVWHSPSARTISWVELTESNIEEAGKGVKVSVSKLRPLDKTAKRDLEKIALERSTRYSTREIELAWDAGIAQARERRRDGFIYQIRGTNEAEGRVITALALIDEEAEQGLLASLVDSDLLFFDRLMTMTQNMDLSRLDDGGKIAEVRSATSKDLIERVANLSAESYAGFEQLLAEERERSNRSQEGSWSPSSCPSSRHSYPTIFAKHD